MNKNFRRSLHTQRGVSQAVLCEGGGETPSRVFSISQLNIIQLRKVWYIIWCYTGTAFGKKYVTQHIERYIMLTGTCYSFSTKFYGKRPILDGG